MNVAGVVGLRPTARGTSSHAVFDAPTVFVCNNNGWAISIPRERQTASETIAQKATAYGFSGVQVDGMDPLACYVAMRAAREKAVDPRPDELRPTLLELVQYRYGAHTTADDPSVYRDEAEVRRWRERDPIDRFETYCRSKGVLDDGRIEGIEAEIEDSLTELIERAEAFEGDPEGMFEFTYEEPTKRLESQREELAALRETYGDEALLRDE